MNFDVNQIRGLFPVLHQEVHGKPLIYFDNAATTQKPKQVLEALTSYYEKDNSNIHRGAHALADRATQYFENTRESVRKFINA
ncbi:MAG TPA: cysteine desulfurase CsdA, partial [Algoriphagus sp.]|nr:cysteine desulfurase CsdA [Algoriphagus sp.]